MRLWDRYLAAIQLEVDTRSIYFRTGHNLYQLSRGEWYVAAPYF